MKATVEIKVRGYHLDAFSHVNNARYLEFLEEGRWRYFEENSIDTDFFAKKGLLFSIVNININYRRGAVLGDALIVVTGIKEIRNKSAVMLQKIYLKGADILVADAEITYVIPDPEIGKATPMDEVKGIWPDPDI